MLLCHHLCTVHSIWFSWSVIWCCLGCGLLLDLQAMLIHVHQWWALFPQGLCHRCTHGISPRKWAVLTAFQTWLGPGSVRWWFDLLLVGLWRSDRLLFSLVSVLLNSKEWLIYSKLLELFLRLVLWKQIENDFFLLVLTVLPMGRNLQHLLMLSWSCCKLPFDPQDCLWGRKLGLLFLTCSPLCCHLGFFWSPGSQSLGMPMWSLLLVLLV